MSKSQELIQIKQDLATLQEEVKDASLKVSEAEKRLLKALEEKEPSSHFVKLLDSASGNLAWLHRKEERLRKAKISLLNHLYVVKHCRHF